MLGLQLDTLDDRPGIDVPARPLVLLQQHV